MGWIYILIELINIKTHYSYITKSVDVPYV